MKKVICILILLAVAFAGYVFYKEGSISLSNLQNQANELVSSVKNKLGMSSDSSSEDQSVSAQGLSSTLSDEVVLPQALSSDYQSPFLDASQPKN